jgi:hypothetical protein
MISATIRHTVVFAILLVATGFSYYAFVTGFNHASSFFAIILSAGLKTSLLLWFFMELRTQSWGLKLYSLIWVVACVSAISILH